MAEALTRFVPILDKQVEVQRPTGGQLLVLAREAGVLQNEDNLNPERKVRSLTRVMTAVESCIVTDEDREYVLDMAAEGKLDLKDLFQTLLAFDEASGEAPAPVRPRRGRPPKRALPAA